MIRRILDLLKKPVTDVPVWLYIMLEILVPVSALLLVLYLFG